MGPWLITNSLNGIVHIRNNQPSITLLYHFFYPDDVVSARLFADATEEFVHRKWKVRVLTSNRYCRYPKKKILQKSEYWRGMHILRLKRPAWNQANTCYRLANTVWMVLGWTWKILRSKKSDVFLVGSDPQFSQLLSPFLKILVPKSLVVYWCHDLYPDAVIADNPNGLQARMAGKTKPVMRWLYQFADVIVDIGPCMQRRIAEYRPKAVQRTLTPWALVEPQKITLSDPEVRHDLFGDARLALLYSGNMGKAHDFELFLALARRLATVEPKIVFCFACRGNRFDELKNSIRKEDLNIRFAPFAKESELAKRLEAADIHLLSLRKAWDGIVVPSKFFGSLAVGRPVLFAGPESSSISQWINEHDIGLILTHNNIDVIMERLIDFANEPQKLKAWQENAFKTYHGHFSKEKVMDKWDVLLLEELNLDYA